MNTDKKICFLFCNVTKLFDLDHLDLLDKICLDKIQFEKKY